MPADWRSGRNFWKRPDNRRAGITFANPLGIQLEFPRRQKWMIPPIYEPSCRPVSSIAVKRRTFNREEQHENSTSQKEEIFVGQARRFPLSRVEDTLATARFA